MNILEIHKQLVDLDIEHQFAKNNFEPEKSKILFNDENFERQIALSTKTKEIDVFVYIAKGKKKVWNAPQTKEQNSACGKEKNRFVKEFNSFDIDFKLTEWMPATTTQKFEGSTKISSTPFDDIEPKKLTITKPADELDYPNFDVSDSDVINGLGEDNPYDNK